MAGARDKNTSAGLCAKKGGGGGVFAGHYGNCLEICTVSLSLFCIYVFVCVTCSLWVLSINLKPEG